ncbi:MAG: hypothetical protein OEV64_04340 [Desulfobulbaceae bacterium]|nr:hypothetical protein [Desulfobulbaceae bacterium]
MSKIIYPAVISFLALLTMGCQKDLVYENLYKGMQKREEIINPPPNEIPPEQQSYHEYKLEREKVLKEADSP